MKIEYATGGGSDCARQTVKKLKKFVADFPNRRNWDCQSQLKYMELQEQRSIVLRKLNNSYRVVGDNKNRKLYKGIAEKLKHELLEIEDRNMFGK